MSIKVDMTSNELDAQVRYLKAFPEVFDQHFRRALVEITDELYDEVDNRMPEGTGYARQRLKKKVTGKGLKLQGYVGWPGTKSAPYYMNVLEHGARDHPMAKGSKSRSKGMRRKFEANKDANANFIGQPVFIKGEWHTVRIHPGVREYRFMRGAYESLQANIGTRLKLAGDEITKELALK